MDKDYKVRLTNDFKSLRDLFYFIVSFYSNEDILKLAKSLKEYVEEDV